MSIFWRNRASKARLDATEKFLDETQARVDEQAPRVNALTLWLTERKMTNGFGEDFEWTLAHPRRSGG